MSNDEKKYGPTCWIVERRLGLGVLLAILVQAATSVWWAADLSARVKSVEEKYYHLAEVQAKQNATMERIAVIEVDVRWIKQTLEQSLKVLSSDGYKLRR